MSLRQWFCRHSHRYREQRDVLHLVCDRCGHAVVAIDRTGEVKAPLTFSAPVKRPRVVPMRERKRA